MTQLRFTIVACLGLASLASHARRASAHFVWIHSETQSGKVKIHAGFGEPGQWDAHLAGKIQQTRYFVQRQGAADTSLTLSLDADAGEFVGEIPPAEAAAVVGICEYGVVPLGPAKKPTKLTYTAKRLIGNPDQWPALPPSKHLPLEVMARRDGDAIRLQALHAGKPLAAAKYTLFGPTSSRKVIVADDKGEAAWRLEGPGEYALYFGHELPRDAATGPEIESFRVYTTLSFHVASATKVAANAATAPLPDLPEAITSFGAAVADGWLYVYGGHTGRAHEHSRDNLSTGFRRLSLEKPTAWEDLPPSQPLQGVSLVAHGGKLYRVGGMSARNAAGEEESLFSLAEVASFDPRTRQWQMETPLPSGRSSHDAVVVDGQLYVIGGWTLRGDEPPAWQTSALVADLRETPLRWRELPKPPFQRRALAVAAASGKVYAVGGMTSEGKTTTGVDAFDPATGTWQTIEPLPGTPRNGFGVAALGVGADLYASGFDGKVYRLNTHAKWEEVGQLTQGRFFHRLAATDKGELWAVAGATRSGHKSDLERVRLRAAAEPGRLSAR